MKNLLAADRNRQSSGILRTNHRKYMNIKKTSPDNSLIYIPAQSKLNYSHGSGGAVQGYGSQGGGNMGAGYGVGGGGYGGIQYGRNVGNNQYSKSNHNHRYSEKSSLNTNTNPNPNSSSNNVKINSHGLGIQTKNSSNRLTDKSKGRYTDSGADIDKSKSRQQSKKQIQQIENTSSYNNYELLNISHSKNFIADRRKRGKSSFYKKNVDVSNISQALFTGSNTNKNNNPSQHISRRQNDNQLSTKSKNILQLFNKIANNPNQSKPSTSSEPESLQFQPVQAHNINNQMQHSQASADIEGSSQQQVEGSRQGPREVSEVQIFSIEGEPDGQARVEIEVEELHYRMVEFQQKVKKAVKN